MFMSDSTPLHNTDAVLATARASHICAALRAGFNAQSPAAAQLTVQWQAVTQSTNADGLAWLRKSKPATGQALLCGALRQQAGRGRAARPWINDTGSQLMMSLATVQAIAPALLPALSLVAGVAACEALEHLIVPNARHRLLLKWPNDLLWDDAKLAGILLESVSEAPQRSSHSTGRIEPVRSGIVLGIGLNLAGAAALSQQLQRPIADWRQVSSDLSADSDDTLIELAQRITQAWLAALKQVSRHGFDPFVERLARRDALAGKAIVVTEGSQVLHQGNAVGVDASGCLQLRTPDGLTRAISVGDIRVLLQSDRRAP